MKYTPIHRNSILRLLHFIVMPSIVVPILLLWELTALSTSDHTRDPRALIYLIPIVLITAVLLLGRMAC